MFVYICYCWVSRVGRWRGEVPCFIESSGYVHVSQCTFQVGYQRERYTHIYVHVAKYCHCHIKWLHNNFLFGQSWKSHNLATSKPEVELVSVSMIGQTVHCWSNDPASQMDVLVYAKQIIAQGVSCQDMMSSWVSLPLLYKLAYLTMLLQ